MTWTSAMFPVLSNVALMGIIALLVLRANNAPLEASVQKRVVSILKGRNLELSKIRQATGRELVAYPENSRTFSVLYAAEGRNASGDLERVILRVRPLQLRLGLNSGLQVIEHGQWENEGV